MSRSDAQRGQGERSSDQGAGVTLGGVVKGGIATAAIVLAGFLIYRTLSGYSWQELRDAVLTVPGARLGGALAFAAASYACLTLFDFLALKYAGKPLAYRRAAVASFTSLSLGHTIGLAALSSGAVRYRFYSRWGLDAQDLAKVILFCGATVGLGLATLAGLVLLAAPDTAARMTGLGRSLMLGLGAAGLFVPSLYLLLAWRLRAPLQIRAWSFQLPPVKLAAGQILVGTVNFALVAACLYQALAAVAEVRYLGVVSAYVAANAVSLISHVPGGLGVMESVVQYLIPGKDLIGPLLVFRFAYFLVPLMLGTLVLLVSEGIARRKAPA
ncbi:MAG: hypothetical protein B7Z15_02525 [Rhizobiales bacterium 32-66-8]|nr:MAG: hypothetical protein B7Z15_02525 [Rhizobiales bacterium 32-66-8]